MAEPRVCLATWFDARFATLGALCLISLHEYGKRHGYDVAVLNGITSARPSSWNKLLAIEALFEKGYDYVFWIDADAVFARYDVPVGTLIETGKDLCLVNLCLRNGGEMPNFGIFFLRNSAWSRELLKGLWGMEEYIGHPWWENAAFIDRAGMAGSLPEGERFRMPEHALRKSPDGAFLAHVAWIGNEWNCVPRTDITYGTPAVIRHFPAQPLAARAWRMARTLRANGLVSRRCALGLWLRSLPCRIRMFCGGLWTKVIRTLRITA